MKIYSGKIIAADSGDNTITIQCRSVSGIEIGKCVIIEVQENVTDMADHRPLMSDLDLLNSSEMK